MWQAGISQYVRLFRSVNHIRLPLVYSWEKQVGIYPKHIQPESHRDEISDRNPTARLQTESRGDDILDIMSLQLFAYSGDHLLIRMILFEFSKYDVPMGLRLPLGIVFYLK